MAKKKAKAASTGIDLDDEDALRAEMAKALDVPADDIEIEESSLTSFGAGDAKRISLGGNKEWTVVADDDVAHEIALASVKQDLESEPEIFNRSFIQGHIDQVALKKWVHDAAMEDNYAEDIASDDAERFWEEADQWGLDLDKLREDEAKKLEEAVTEKFRELAVFGSTPVDEAKSDAEDELPRGVTGEWSNLNEFTVLIDDDIPLPDDVPQKYIDQLQEAIAEDKAKDPMAFFEDIYGKDEAAKHAIEAVGIDIAAAAEEAVQTDGWQHFLARYDGNSEETDSGLVYWRDN